MYNIVMLILVIKLFDPNSWLSKDRQKKNVIILRHSTASTLFSFNLPNQQLIKCQTLLQ